MKDLAIAIAKTPVLGRALLVGSRAVQASRYFTGPLSRLVRWLFVSRETTNYTYDLEASNKRYLASLVSNIANIPFSQAQAYLKEIDSDQALRDHIARATEASDFAYKADKKVLFGRRIGWYALVRAMKPKVVIETGVDKGVGACVLTAALKRNRAEGFEGQYYGTDINPNAGYLLSGEYANYGRILYGDSIKSLNALQGQIDLFINDSDHSAEYEGEEYKTVAGKLSDRAIVLGDNSHATDKLLEFSLAAGRHFVFFQERPLAHWYPGGGIGISFKR